MTTYSNVESRIESGVGEDPIPKVDVRQEHYPLCIVWTPIPFLSWLCPAIGHLGIATSEGIINDFIGPYTIHKHPKYTGFGPVYKYCSISYEDVHDYGKANHPAQSIDDAIEKASQIFKFKMHNLIFNNCHSHVSVALNELQFKGFTHWNTLFLILYMMVFSHYVSFARFVRLWLCCLV
eukprot:CAMPEP_0168570338 /NCGR_PEP_ID=MMETSP0413-20121227/16664_1 /TAXON_ID=136452 /ORGANISM="Filamoeba nolandi, Strain NC-AS-23-1" /LENGTH=178 /DNA_ID=CAMNT_0008602947 /DNA_START=8 /DNA_END=544 /DNA_ORIENTATION=-